MHTVRTGTNMAADQTNQAVTTDCPPSSTSVPLRLQVIGTSRHGQIVEISTPRVAIGSGPQCTLRLRAAGVQPLHCLIVREPAGFVAQCLSGETLLNGQKFHVQALVPGDRLRIGAVELQLCDPAAVHQWPAESFLRPRVPDRARPGSEAERWQTDELFARLGRIEQQLEQLRASDEVPPAARGTLTGSQDGLPVTDSSGPDGLPASTLHADLARLQQERDELAGRLEQTSSECAVARDAIAQLECERDELYRRCELQSCEVEHTRADYFRALSEERQVRVLQEHELREQASRITELDSLVESLQSDLAHAHSTLDLQRSEAEYCQAELDRTRSEVLRWQTEASRWEEYARCNEEEMGRYQLDAEAAHLEVDTWKKEARQHEQAAAQRQSEAEQAQVTIERLERDAARSREQLGRLQAEATLAQQQLAEVRANADRAQQETAWWSARAERIRQSARQWKQSAQAQHMRAARGQATLSSLRDEVQRWQDQATASQADAAQWRARAEQGQADAEQSLLLAKPQHPTSECPVADPEPAEVAAESGNDETASGGAVAEATVLARETVDSADQPLDISEAAPALSAQRRRDELARLTQQFASSEPRMPVATRELAAEYTVELEIVAEPEPEVELEIELPEPEQPADCSSKEDQPGDADDVLARLYRAGIWKDSSSSEPADSECGETVQESPEQILLVTTAGGHGEDDSIENYMERLLQRVRGDCPKTPVKVEHQDFDPERRPVTEVDLQLETPDEPAPLTESDYLPRSQAPEVTVDLAALREIGNERRRSDILSHAQRTWCDKTRNKLAGAVAGAIVAGGSFLFLDTHPEWAAVGLLTGGGLAYIWTRQALHYRKQLFDSVKN